MTRTALKQTLAASFFLSALCTHQGADTAAQVPGSAAPSVTELFAQSLKAIKPVDDYQGEFVKRERIEDELKLSGNLFFAHL